ncbi:MAG: ATP-binding protein [Planctomycetota bacterium]|jgi:PAS domain S-box-containing protein
MTGIFTGSILYINLHFLGEEIDNLQYKLHYEQIKNLISTAAEKEKTLALSPDTEDLRKEAKKQLIKNIADNYYSDNYLEAYPFILTRRGKVVTHPLLPKSSRKINIPELVEKISKMESGELYFSEKNKAKWCIFDTFTPWDWVFIYTLEAEHKNSAVLESKKNTVILLISVTILISILVFIFSEKLFNPFKAFLESSKELSRRSFPDDIDTSDRQDEVGAVINACKAMTEELNNRIKVLQQKIDKQKVIEEDLHIQKSLLESGQESSIEGIIVFDNEGKILSCNSKFHYLWGMDDDILLGSGIKELAEKLTGKICDPDFFTRCLSDTVDITDSTRHEIVKLVNDKYLDFYTSPAKNNEGEIFGRAWFFRDITVRKNAERERDILLESLAEKNEELETIIYVTSHDLRSPLVNLFGFSNELNSSCAELDSLLTDKALPDTGPLQRCRTILQDDIPSALKFISSSSAKMDSLLKGLLRLSRLGRTALNKTIIDTNLLLSDVSETMQFQLKQVNAVLTIEELPECYGDYDQVNQVFSNLLDNALKYRDSKRILQIKVSGSIQHGFSIFTVEDNGRGIKESHQERIFEIFHRLNPDNDTEGEGLGLPIIKRILNRHGGSISVNSNGENGSIFYVSLPSSKNTAL